MKPIKKISHSVQRGFTLIELMIVVAIIAILATLAFPAYVNYTNRAKVPEALLAGSSCRLAIAEYASSRQAIPAQANSYGCEINVANSLALADVASEFVTSMSTTPEGVITIVTRGLTTDGTIQLSPLRNGVIVALGGAGNALPLTIEGWQCAPGPIVGAFDPLATEFLPSTCQN